MRVVSLRPELTIAIGKRRIKFSRVPRADILIISTDTATELAAYFPGRKTYILDIDTHTYFAGALVKCLLLRKLNFASYLAAVVNLSRAELAISLQDNFLPLFQVKSMLSNSKIALIQNGQRSVQNDLEGEIFSRDLRNLAVDFYFAFTESYATRLSKLTAGNVLVTGSFRSNFTKKFVGQKYGVSYISTYNPEVLPASEIATESTSGVVDYQMILEARIRVLRVVIDICAARGTTLSILGKRSGELAIAEKTYYQSCLPKDSFTFRARETYSSSYLACDCSEIVISTGSTLGYESLGRGNRTAIFRPDFHLLADKSLKFGWPLDLPDEGQFWSTASSTSRVHEVLTYLQHVSEPEWLQHLSDVEMVLPRLNSGNSVLVEALSIFGARKVSHH